MANKISMRLFNRFLLVGTAFFMVIVIINLLVQRSVPADQKVDRTGKVWLVIEQKSATTANRYQTDEFEMMQSVVYQYKSRDWKDSTSFYEFKAPQLSQWIALGKPIFQQGRLIFTPCTTVLLESAARLACLDAIERSIAVDWAFNPSLLPSWISSTSIRPEKLMAWFRGKAVFKSSMPDHYLLFPVVYSHFSSANPAYKASDESEAAYIPIDPMHRFASYPKLAAIVSRPRESSAEKHAGRLGASRFSFIAFDEVIDNEQKLLWSFRGEVDFPTARARCLQAHARLPKEEEVVRFCDVGASNEGCPMIHEFSMSSEIVWTDNELKTVVFDLTKGLVYQREGVAAVWCVQALKR